MHREVKTGQCPKQHWTSYGEEVKAGQGKNKTFHPCIHQDICPVFTEADLLWPAAPAPKDLSPAPPGSSSWVEWEWNGRCFQPDFCLQEHSTLSVLAPQYQGNSKINGCASEWDLNINHQEGGQLCKAHSSHPGLHLAQKVMKWCVTPGSSCDRHPCIGSGMEMWESLAQSYLSCTTLTLSPLHSLPLKP